MQHKWKIKPDKVQIGGHVYPIIQDDIQVKYDLVGYSQHRPLTEIAIERGVSSALKDETLIHEIFHAIDRVYLNSSLSEAEINALGSGFHQVLQQWGVEFDWEDDC